MTEEDNKEMTVEFLDSLLKPMHLKVKSIAWNRGNIGLSSENNGLDDQVETNGFRVEFTFINVRMLYASINIIWQGKKIQWHSSGITSLGFSLEECIREIVEYLMSEICEFEIEYPICSAQFDVKSLKTKNIYFGCRSLEEMMIKRDLLSDED